MELWLMMRGGVVEQAAFRTDGCGISHACGSMATVLAQGKTLEEIETVEPEHIIESFGGLPSDHEHCAQLAVSTLLLASANSIDMDMQADADYRLRGQMSVRVCIPIESDRIAQRCVDCAGYALVDVDPETVQALRKVNVPAPEGRPESLPAWAARCGVHVFVCCAMEQDLQEQFSAQGIQVVVEAFPEIPDCFISDFIVGNLASG